MKYKIYGIIIVVAIAMAVFIFMNNNNNNMNNNKIGICDECGQTEKLSTYIRDNGEKEQVCDYCKNMMKFFGY